MSFYNYHFVTHWKICGSIQKVYTILKDGPNYSQWWKPAYVSTEKIGTDKVRSLVRAKLPYTLSFTTELIRENPPHELEIKATGELAGRGLWKLSEDGEWVDITFYWDVAAQKPIVQWLSFFLRPVFRWNHDWVMKQGEKTLQKRVDLTNL